LTIHVSGSAYSTTLTAEVHEEVLPAASVAVYVTGVVPSGKRDCVGLEIRACEHVSVARAAPSVTVTSAPSRASTTIGSGQTMLGGCVSATATWRLSVTLWLDGSVTE
jgi:hypothetical protein